MSKSEPTVTGIAWALIWKWTNAELESKSKKFDLNTCELIKMGRFKDALRLRGCAIDCISKHALARRKKAVTKRSLGLAMKLAWIYKENGDKFVESHLGAWL